MTEVQVSAIMCSRAAAPTTLARADLYVEHRFRLLEYNMGSPLGDIDNADLVRALLEQVITDWPSRYEKLAPSLRLYCARLC
jgi:hypothetical protein